MAVALLSVRLWGTQEVPNKYLLGTCSSVLLDMQRDIGCWSFLGGLVKERWRWGSQKLMDRNHAAQGPGRESEALERLESLLTVSAMTRYVVSL